MNKPRRPGIPADMREDYDRVVAHMTALTLDTLTFTTERTLAAGLTLDPDPARNLDQLIEHMRELNRQGRMQRLSQPGHPTRWRLDPMVLPEEDR